MLRLSSGNKVQWYSKNTRAKTMQKSSDRQWHDDVYIVFDMVFNKNTSS